MPVPIVPYSPKATYMPYDAGHPALVMAALGALRVDHVVWAVPYSLEEGMREFERKTGITPSIGGVHQGLGTHNAIASLGNGMYWEILARDPLQLHPPRTWMGIGQVVEPKIVTWAAAVPDLSEAVAKARSRGYDPGSPTNFEREVPGGGKLYWSLAFNHYDQLPGNGIVPFLINWGETKSPASTAPTGCKLVALKAVTSDTSSVSEMLRAVDINPSDLQLREARAPRITAILETPRGLVEF
eukprot:6178669-Pleurochrysis_carterae.AAC.1